jgi:hypothetical protein
MDRGMTTHSTILGNLTINHKMSLTWLVLNRAGPHVKSFHFRHFPPLSIRGSDHYDHVFDHGHLRHTAYISRRSSVSRVSFQLARAMWKAPTAGAPVWAAVFYALIPQIPTYLYY